MGVSDQHTRGCYVFYICFCCVTCVLEPGTLLLEIVTIYLYDWLLIYELMFKLELTGKVLLIGWFDLVGF